MDAYFQFLGGEIHAYSKEFDERLGQGRWLDYALRAVPAMAIIALFFLDYRLFFWVILSLLQLLRTILFIFENPNVYFENDWNILLSDGWAMNT